MIKIVCSYNLRFQIENDFQRQFLTVKIDLKLILFFLKTFNAQNLYLSQFSAQIHQFEFWQEVGFNSQYDIVLSIAQNSKSKTFKCPGLLCKVVLRPIKWLLDRFYRYISTFKFFTGITQLLVKSLYLFLSVCSPAVNKIISVRPYLLNQILFK